MDGVPFLTYGVPPAMDDAAIWIPSGSIVITPGQTDPFGGTDAYLLDDQSASFESVSSVGLFTTEHAGDYIVPFWLREGSAGATVLQLRVEGGVQVLGLSLTWSGGVPTFISPSSLILQDWTAYGTTGWYVTFAVARNLAANTAHAVVYNPAGAVDSDQGTCFAYWQRAIRATFPISNPRSGPQPRADAMVRTRADLTRVAYRTGTEHRARLGWRFLGLRDETGEAFFGSGWDGPLGVQAAIEEMWNQAPVRIHPRAEDPGLNFVGYLEEPKDAMTEDGEDGTAQVDFTFYADAHVGGLGKVSTV